MTEVSPCVVVRVACERFDSLVVFRSQAALRAEQAWAAAETSGRAAREVLEHRLHAAAGPPSTESQASQRRFRILAMRRALHHGILPSMDQLSADVDGVSGLLTDAAAALATRESARDSLQAALERADLESSAALSDRVRDPDFAEGLFLAGEDLLQSAQRLVQRSFSNWRARERQVAATTLRYAVRAATKTSPQGVFCATAIAGWEDRTRLSGSARPARTLARINISEARKLTSPLEAELARHADARIGLNPSLNAHDEQWRFWRAATADDPSALERHLTIRSTPALLALTQRLAGCGPDGETRASLLSWIGADAEAWLDRLIELGLLSVRSGLPYSEPRPLQWLARAAAPMVAAESGALASAFEVAESRIDDIALAAGADERTALYRAAKSILTPLPADAPLDLDGLLRVDAAAAIDAALELDVARELARVVPAYARFFAALYPGRLLLDPHVRRFRALHPADRDVPLLEVYHGVFDGLGAGARTAFPDAGRVAPGAPEVLAAGARAARQRWQAMLEERFNEETIRLEDSDWDHLAGDTPPPRFACGVLFQCAAVERGPGRVILNGLYGAGLAAARLAWLHTGGATPETGALARDLREGWEWLAPPGAIVAEIPFRHAGRTANAGLKPRVFEHEIELPGEVPAPGAVTIPLSDLSLRYEEASGRFVIFSRGLAREVVPVLTNGLSPEGFVAFLVAVGQQHAQPLAYFQDCHPGRLGLAPPVISGRTVLFRRRWSLSALDASRIFPSGGSAPERFSRVQRWREESGVPGLLFASSERSPRPLHVDLDAPWLFEDLAALARDGSVLTLREMDPVPSGSGVEGHAIEYLAHVRSSPGGGLTIGGTPTTMPA